MFIIIYSNRRAIDVVYTIEAFSLEHKKCYNVVTGKEKYIIYVLQKVRRDFLLPLRGV